MAQKGKTGIKNAFGSLVLVSLLAAGNSFLREIKYSIATLRSALIIIQIKEKQDQKIPPTDTRKRAEEELAIQLERKKTEAKLASLEKERELIEELDALLENDQDQIEADIDVLHRGIADYQLFITQYEGEKEKARLAISEIKKMKEQGVPQTQIDLAVTKAVERLRTSLKECHAVIEETRYEKAQYVAKKEKLDPLINNVLALTDPALFGYQESLRNFRFHFDDFINSYTQFEKQTKQAQDELTSLIIQLEAL